MEFSLNRKKSAGTVLGSALLVFGLWNGGNNYGERRADGEDLIPAGLQAATIDNLNDIADGMRGVANWVDDLIFNDNESQALSVTQQYIAGTVIHFSQAE